MRSRIIDDPLHNLKKGHTDFITETLQAPICCCLIDSPLAEKLAENSKHIKRQFPCVSNDLCAS